LVEARRTATPLGAFPGPLPASLEAAYEIQNSAITLWGDALVGWKVGRVPDPLVETLGADRLIGAIFARNIWPAGAGQAPDVAIIRGGFGAVEAELVYRVGHDAPRDKTRWTHAEAIALVTAMHLGVEIAGSPLAAINDLGPTVVASDFGNNAGLVLGPEVADWRDRDPGEVACQTFIDGHAIGENRASSLPGGPVQALVFALGAAAQIGRPIRAGQLISTGAITGVHAIAPGQSARVLFKGIGEISCRAIAATRYESPDGSNEKGVMR
jgi:2-keto-4-pentenoate hydratase